MKVLVHISANIYKPLPNSGHTSLIWKELSKSFDKYHVLARGESRYKKAKSCDGIINLHLLPMISRSQIWSLLLIFHQVVFLCKTRPTHIICQCPVLGGGAAYIYKKFICNKVRLVFEIHGEHLLRARSASYYSKLEFLFFRMLGRLTIKEANVVRSLSREMTNNIVAVYGNSISLDNIKYIPNRVDVKLFNCELKERNLDKSTINLITVGNFSPIKNHLKLIENLSEIDVNFRLTIVGGGELRSEYYKKIEQLSLQDRVKVIGPFSHAELVKEYSNNDIYIHYSLTEGFPRVILEAQSCGLPVISSNVGYISDILSDGENVILLKDYTPESLKEKLDYIMIEDNHIRIKENGRIHVLKNFDSTVIYDKYRKVILGEEE